MEPKQQNPRCAKRVVIVDEENADNSQSDEATVHNGKIDATCSRNNATVFYMTLRCPACQ